MSGNWLLDRPSGPLLRRLWSMMVGIALGTWIGGWAGDWLLTGPEAGRAAAALGVALVLYAIVGLANVRCKVSARAEPWLSPLIGTLTGLTTAATGVFVIPAVPYLQALDLDRDDLIQALGLSFTVSTMALAAILARDGAFKLSMVGTSLLALAPALVGMWTGQWVRLRVSASVFRVCFFVGLLALGAHLTLRLVL
jgi:uncharacterized membrane protein YfcA